MDVFHVGASAPRPPESKGVERDAAQRAAAKPQPGAGSGDAFASSSGAAAVAKHVERLNATHDVREDVVKSVRALLGRGLLDTPAAAEHAAQGILDS